MKKIIYILALFLLLSIPFTACAEDTGHVVIRGKNGNVLSKDEQAVIPKSSNDNENKSEEGGKEKVIETSSDDVNTYIKAAQTAYENALEGFTQTMISALFDGAVTIYETDLNETEDGTVTYNIHVRSLNPYDHPLVLPMQLIIFCFLLLAAFIVILGSLVCDAFQTKAPEKYGEWKRTVSGVYEPYNPRRTHNACMWAVIRPIKAFIFFIIIVILRNTLISSMPQTASGILSTTSDNIIIQAITGVAIFVGSFQTTMGEFGFFAFSSLLFFLYLVTDVIILVFNSPGTAKNVEFVSWGAFLLFCFCDLINMFFTSFGVYTSMWLGESIYITDGIIGGAFINSVLLATLTIVAIFKGKKAIGA